MNRSFLVAIALGLLTLTGCGAVIDKDAPPSPVVESNSLGNGGECDPSLVTAHPMALDGASVRVSAPAGETVTLDVYSGFEHRRLVQQVSSRGAGAEFLSWNHASSNGDASIRVTTKRHGSCVVEGLSSKGGSR